MFIKRVGDIRDRYFVEIELCNGDTAARLTKRVCKEFPHWGVHAEQMRLLHVLGGREEARNIERNPSSAAGILPCEQLFSGDPVIPGSWLLARVPPPVAAAPGASEPREVGALFRHTARAPALMSDASALTPRPSPPIPPQLSTPPAIASSLPQQRTYRHPHQHPRPCFKAAWISALAAAAAVVVVAVVAAAAVAAATVAAVAGGTPAQFPTGRYNPYPRLQGPFLSTRSAS